MPVSADAPILSTMSLAESLADTIGSTGIEAGGATVARLGAVLGNGGLTAAELTAFYLARIGRLNPGLHAVIRVNPAAAAEAAASDDRRARDGARGPLDGIPVLIKDNISAAGLPATAGSPALERAAATDAFLVARLRAAGAVILGKANLSEWANFRSRPSSSGLSTLGGQAVNPHSPGRSPSGSSSGSAAAIAAGLAPLAVGSETDGSIVSPASACGTVGIKPTLGLVSRSGIVPISAAQDTAGPMTRTVADAAALLSVMAGFDPGDPATERAASEACDYSSFLDPSALAGARLGVWRDGSKDADRATAAVLDAAIVRLRAQGAEVVDPVRAGRHRQDRGARGRRPYPRVQARPQRLSGRARRRAPGRPRRSHRFQRRACGDACCATSARSSSKRPRRPAATSVNRLPGGSGGRRRVSPGRRWTAQCATVGWTPSCT